MKCVVIHCLLTVHLMKKNNKLDYYRGKYCLKKFCQDLKKQAKSIVDFEKKNNAKNHFLKMLKIIILK